jgi:ribosomal protein S18 acetylase RimI-like enzyme
MPSTRRSAQVTVRAATEADLPRVAEIKVSGWADTYAPLLDPSVLGPFLDEAAQLQDLGEELRRPSTLFLVAEEDGGAVIGFALTYAGEQPDPWLESLHVMRESRGAGAGTRLVRATAAQLLAGGHHTMRLGVVQGNSAAGRFYERLGGTMTGREPASWAEGVWHEIYRWDDISRLA